MKIAFSFPACNFPVTLFLLVLSHLCSPSAYGESSVSTIDHGSVKIGVILPFSGDFARYGDKIRHGLELSRSANAQYLYEDEGCNPKSAVSAYKKLTVVDGVKLFIGPFCGSPQTVVASQIAKNDQFALLGNSAPRSVFELSNGRMLGIQHSLEEESAFNAREAYRLGARKVVITFLDNDFSRAHEASFREHFKGEVLETITYASPDASALRAILLRIKKLSPDTLYIPDAFPLLQGLIKQLHEVGLGGIKIFSVYSAQSDDVLAAVGDAGEGIIISYPKIEGDALSYFPEKASELMGKALHECPQGDPSCVGAAIKKLAKFDKFGTVEGELGLKVIRGGKFEWIKD